MVTSSSPWQISQDAAEDWPETAGRRDMCWPARVGLLAQTIYLTVGGQPKDTLLPLNFSRHRKNNPQIGKSYRAKKNNASFVVFTSLFCLGEISTAVTPIENGRYLLVRVANAIQNEGVLRSEKSPIQNSASTLGNYSFLNTSKIGHISLGGLLLENTFERGKMVHGFLWLFVA